MRCYDRQARRSVIKNQRAADFCLGGNCGAEPVRQVKACEAVDAACRSFPGPVCPDHDCPIDIPVSAPLPAQDLLNAFAGDPVTDVSTFGFTAAVPECGVGYTLHWESGATVPANPCPHRQYYGIQATPWTDGQVTDHACELCTIGYSSPGTLFIEIKEEFGQTLEDLTLICGTNAFRLPGSLLPGDRRLVTGIPAACETENVVMAFRFTRDGIDSASVVSPTLRIADRDGDGVQDALDNCYDDANPLQIDADSDSIGNRCDGDFNNDCVVNAFDLGILKSVYFSSDPIVDLSEDGTVNVLGLAIFKRQFFQPPGPSGIANICTP
jgi:hypothetical protein